MAFGKIFHLYFLEPKLFHKPHFYPDNLLYYISNILKTNRICTKLVAFIQFTFRKLLNTLEVGKIERNIREIYIRTYTSVSKLFSSQTASGKNYYEKRHIIIINNTLGNARRKKAQNKITLSAIVTDF